MQTQQRQKTTIFNVFRLLKPHTAITVVVMSVGIVSSGLALLQPLCVNYLLHAIEQSQKLVRPIAVLALLFVAGIVLDGLGSNMANRLAAKIVSINVAISLPVSSACRYKSMIRGSRVTMSQLSSQILMSYAQPCHQTSLKWPRIC